MLQKLFLTKDLDKIKLDLLTYVLWNHIIQFAKKDSFLTFKNFNNTLECLKDDFHYIQASLKISNYRTWLKISIFINFVYYPKILLEKSQIIFEWKHFHQAYCSVWKDLRLMFSCAHLSSHVIKNITISR